MKNRIKDLRTEKGWSQGDLAERLRVSRQTVNALESGRSDPSLPLAFRIAWVFEKELGEVFLTDLEDKMTVLQATWQYQDRVATAFDEVGVLEGMGDEGWEMIGFGPGYLRFRRPEDLALRVRWRYERVSGILSSGNRTNMEAQGWVFCGSWMGVFHYFKRGES